MSESYLSIEFENTHPFGPTKLYAWRLRAVGSDGLEYEDYFETNELLLNEIEILIGYFEDQAQREAQE